LPRFVATHTIPYTEAEFKEMLKQPLPQFPPGVTWKLTYCGFDDHKWFCEWEAPNKEAIKQVFKAWPMPFDDIYQVRLFDVAKMELEP